MSNDGSREVGRELEARWWAELLCLATYQRQALARVLARRESALPGLVHGVNAAVYGAAPGQYEGIRKLLARERRAVRGEAACGVVDGLSADALGELALASPVVVARVRGRTEAVVSARVVRRLRQKDA